MPPLLLFLSPLAINKVAVQLWHHILLLKTWVFLGESRRFGRFLFSLLSIFLSLYLHLFIFLLVLFSLLITLSPPQIISSHLVHLLAFLSHFLGAHPPPYHFFSCNSSIYPSPQLSSSSLFPCSYIIVHLILLSFHLFLLLPALLWSVLRCQFWRFRLRSSSSCSPSCCRATVAGRRTFQRTPHRSFRSDCTTGCRLQGVRKTSFFLHWVCLLPSVWWSWEPGGLHWRRYERLWDSVTYCLVR